MMYAFLSFLYRLFLALTFFFISLSACLSFISHPRSGPGNSPRPSREGVGGSSARRKSEYTSEAPFLSSPGSCACVSRRRGRRRRRRRRRRRGSVGHSRSPLPLPEKRDSNTNTKQRKKEEDLSTSSDVSTSLSPLGASVLLLVLRRPTAHKVCCRKGKGGI